MEPRLTRPWSAVAITAGRWDERRAEAATIPWASWRDAFVRAPYLRDTFVAMGVMSETFETADHLGSLRGASTATVMDRTTAAVASCVRRRLGHVPLHPRLPRRPGPLFHGPGAGAAGRGAGAVARGQGAPRRRRSWPAGARSPTTTRSGAITARGMTASDRIRSRRRCERPRRRWIRRERSTRGSSIDPSAHERPSSVSRAQAVRAAASTRRSADGGDPGREPAQQLQPAGLDVDRRPQMRPPPRPGRRPARRRARPRSAARRTRARARWRGGTASEASS